MFRVKNRRRGWDLPRPSGSPSGAERRRRPWRSRDERFGPVKMEPLRDVDVESLQRGETRRVLDALGDDLHAETVCQRGGERDDVAIGWVRGDTGDEASIDLHLVEVEISQPRQR